MPGERRTIRTELEDADTRGERPPHRRGRIQRSVRHNYAIRTLPVFLAFLAMGFGDAVGPFVGLAKTSFQLSNTVATLIPFVGFIMFGTALGSVRRVPDKRGRNWY